MSDATACFYHRTEYGILEDRRRDGLGIRCLTFFYRREHAEAFVAQRPADAYPVEIKTREVCHTDWATPQWVADASQANQEPQP